MGFTCVCMFVMVAHMTCMFKFWTLGGKQLPNKLTDKQLMLSSKHRFDKVVMANVSANSCVLSHPADDERHYRPPEVVFCLPDECKSSIIPPLSFGLVLTN